MRWIPLFLLALVLGSGCTTYTAVFDLRMVAVERLSEDKVRTGKEGIKRLGGKGVTIYIFEDEKVSFFWVPEPTRFQFKMVNKTDQTMKIIWDEAAYVDEKGESRRVVHSGIDYKDKGNSQPPSMVVMRGKFSDFVLPADRITYEEGIDPGWRENHLFVNPGRNKGALKAQAMKFVGKSVKVLLPMQIKGALHEYIFTFEIKGFKIE